MRAKFRGGRYRHRISSAGGLGVLAARHRRPRRQMLFCFLYLPARTWLREPLYAVTPPAPLPFPSGVERMYPSQRAAVKAAAVAAAPRSASSTETLLRHLNSSSFRAGLYGCCAAAHLHERSAHELLYTLRNMVYSSELIHNFDGSFESDVTIAIGANNATDYFPSTWQLRFLEYYGPRFSPRFGFPSSPEASSEEGVFRLPPYSGPHDEPLTYAAASSRLLYIALNMLRADVGNPTFGNVTAVFSPSFWRDAIVAAPADSGLYTMFCNRTYMRTPGAVRPHFDPGISCNGSDITAGSHGQIDHVLLNNFRFWRRFGDVLLRYFARSYSAATPVTVWELSTYIEPNILANALYREGPRALKMLVGSFAPLFGTARGQILRRWALARSVALLWAVGNGRMSQGDSFANASFAGDLRVLDIPTSGHLVNTSSTVAHAQAFERWWDAVAAARGPTDELSPPQVWGYWRYGVESSTLPPSAWLSVARAGDCTDWVTCLGRSTGAVGHGTPSCVCRTSDV